MTPTCFSCKHSQGISWTRSDLWCVIHKRRCGVICARHECEPGADEPRDVNEQ